MARINKKPKQIEISRKELWEIIQTQDHMLGVRNMILQELSEYLTEEHKKMLANEDK